MGIFSHVKTLEQGQKEREATQFMLRYLMNDVDELDTYESDFVIDVNNSFNSGVPLTARQKDFLYELFNKY